MIMFAFCNESFIIIIIQAGYSFTTHTYTHIYSVFIKITSLTTISRPAKPRWALLQSSASGWIGFPMRYFLAVTASVLLLSVHTRGFFSAS